MTPPPELVKASAFRRYSGGGVRSQKGAVLIVSVMGIVLVMSVWMAATGTFRERLVPGAESSLKSFYHCESALQEAAQKAFAEHSLQASGESSGVKWSLKQAPASTNALSYEIISESRIYQMEGRLLWDLTTHKWRWVYWRMKKR